MIRKIKHQQIDKKKWDEVVTDSDYRHVYLLSWFLDAVSPGWECLAEDDYSMVFPLPVKHKFGIPYLVQPPFCQKFGVIGIGVKTSNARPFFSWLYWHYPYFNLQFEKSAGFEKRRYLNGRINYTLDLTPAYERLLKEYNRNTIRNLQKAKTQLTIQPCQIDEFISFSLKYMKGLDGFARECFQPLIEAALKANTALLYKVCNREDQTVAVSGFIVWNMQILNLACASSPEGREKRAICLVVDRIIKDFAETGFLFDMEGSMIPGVANFFRGFGAKSFDYYSLKKYLFLYK
jgi:hypothetical protein